MGIILTSNIFFFRYFPIISPSYNWGGVCVNEVRVHEYRSEFGILIVYSAFRDCSRYSPLNIILIFCNFLKNV